MPCLYLMFSATTSIYTLSLHDALPIYPSECVLRVTPQIRKADHCVRQSETRGFCQDAFVCILPLLSRSEEHTSELQSHSDLVCRLLLEKKKAQIFGAHGDQLAVGSVFR